MLREGGFVTFSQNFITDPGLVARLLRESDIAVPDTVIDIGAGKGSITKLLAGQCGRVIAVEIDKKLFDFLTQNLKLSNLTLINDDILNVNLPQTAYKVFSNIPFNYTSRIMDKLFFRENSPQSAYIIMQAEASEMYVGYPRETQKSLLLKPFFYIDVFYKFKNTDFKPVPSVDVVMLRVKKREMSLVDPEDKKDYFDFIVYGTTQHKKTLQNNLKRVFTHEQFKRLSKDLMFPPWAKPLDLEYHQWLGLYRYYKISSTSEKKTLVKGSFKKQWLINSSMPKFHRTRCAGRKYPTSTIGQR